jgi:uncharacterized membrane protein YphA (DoxX/SURF4 family)
MFSAYPDGWPGVGLLLLRAAAACVLVAQGIAFLRYKPDPGPMFGAIALLTIGIGALLLVGFLTRSAIAAAALGTLGSMLSAFSGPKVGLVETRMTAALALLIAAAVVSLGPGAFSVDARLFGRREVIIPRHPNDPEI